MPVTKPALDPAGSVIAMQITGDLGGITYVQAPDGRRLSFAKTFPTQQPTAKQLTRRQAFAAAMASWQALTPGQKATLKEITRRYQMRMLAHNVWISLYLFERTSVAEEWAANLGLPW